MSVSASTKPLMPPVLPPAPVQAVLDDRGLAACPLPRRPVAYAAGPDVFWALNDDQLAPYGRTAPYLRGEFVARQKQLFTDVGLDVRHPADDTFDDIATLAGARAIRRACEAHIRNADVVVANLSDYRGYEPDSGTVMELGYAYGLGMPPCAYGVHPNNQQQRMAAAGNTLPDNPNLDPEGRFFETFPLPGNVMWAEACLSEGVLSWQIPDIAPNDHLQTATLKACAACGLEVAAAFYSGQFALRD